VSIESSPTKEAMIQIIETENNGNTTLRVEYAPLRCNLEATFYAQDKKLGTWIGGGDDWVEDFEPCDSLPEARNLLTKTMLNFMTIADSTL
jgi:hypothetical protein